MNHPVFHQTYAYQKQQEMQQAARSHRRTQESRSKSTIQLNVAWPKLSAITSLFNLAPHRV